MRTLTRSTSAAVNHHLRFYPLLASMALLGAAGCDSIGACEGWSELFDKGYCNDNYSEEECEEWDSLEVNGAEWYFHPGQTCEERGY